MKGNCLGLKILEIFAETFETIFFQRKITDSKMNDGFFVAPANEGVDNQGFEMKESEKEQYFLYYI